MADWTDIPDDNLAPGAPGRSADIIAIRDNISAQAEGATGAPKTQASALADELYQAGEVGTYAMMLHIALSERTFGDTASGSNLRFSNASGDYMGVATGTWRCMGYSAGTGLFTSENVTLWLRIS